MPDLSGLRSRLSGRSSAKGGGAKVPGFAEDVYYDLRERRLLPLVALIAVAIAATPFLLGDDGEGPPPAPPSATATPGGAAGAGLTVVESAPGLRDYRRRLRGTPADPFVQQYTSVPSSSKLKSTGEGGGSTGAGGSSGASGGKSGSSTESGAGGSEGGSGSGGSGSGGSGDSGGSGGGKADSGVRLIEFRFTVQVSRSEETANGGQKMGEPQVRRRVPALTQLPGKKVPVVTVAGVNLHSGRVFFLVSDDVRSLDGDFVCTTRPPKGLCELLEIEPGFPLEAVYGENEVRYRFKVTKIDAVWAGKPGDGRSSRASFGPGPDGFATNAVR